MTKTKSDTIVKIDHAELMSLDASREFVDELILNAFEPD